MCPAPQVNLLWTVSSRSCEDRTCDSCFRHSGHECLQGQCSWHSSQVPRDRPSTARFLLLTLKPSRGQGAASKMPADSPSLPSLAVQHPPGDSGTWAGMKGLWPLAEPARWGAPARACGRAQAAPGSDVGRLARAARRRDETRRDVAPGVVFLRCLVLRSSVVSAGRGLHQNWDLGTSGPRS